MFDIKKQIAPHVPPLWVLLVILVIGAIEPVSHWAIVAFPPEDAAATGAHTVDTTNYLVGMAHGHAPWHSPYARCSGPCADGDPSLFSLVHHRVYGVVGMFSRVLGLAPFFGLAWANAFGAAFGALAAWSFFRATVPRIAHGAFALYALGGGLGGLLYVLSATLGWTASESFGPLFLRYFYYELCEGPRFQPWLMVSRLYYTLAFGWGLLALRVWFRALTEERTRDAFLASLFLFLCSVLNLRLGPMFWLVALLMACSVGSASAGGRLIRFTAPTLGLVAGAFLVLRMAATNPELLEGVSINAQSALWLSPFISATVFYWLFVPQALPRALIGAPRWLRMAGTGAMGYLAAFLALYGGYQLYYGNLLQLADSVVAIRCSDWALLGVPPGLWAGYKWRERAADGADAPPWAALWLLALLPASISAWGQGWYLQFSPDRFVVTLGVPMAILAAATLQRCRPRTAGVIYGAILGCGVLSMAVTWSVTYGPLGYGTIQRHYTWTGFVYMDADDRMLLDQIDGGVVLAPSLGAPLFGDLAALRPGTGTVYGNGTLDYSRDVMPVVRAAVAEFFARGAPESERRALIDQWCVRYVYCPATTPIDEAVRAELRQLPWLEVLAEAGSGVLFRVVRDS